MSPKSGQGPEDEKQFQAAPSQTPEELEEQRRFRSRLIYGVDNYTLMKK